MALFINKRFVGLVIVLALAVVSWWLQQHEEKVHGEPQSEDGLVIDYAIRDFEMTAMDEQGQPRNRLKAVSMEHFSNDDSALLKQPDLLVYRESGEPWRLTSGLAKVFKGGEVVHMSGGVQMRRLDDAGTTTMQVDTDELWVYADREYAESEEMVFIKDSMGTTEAKGMTIDLAAGRLQLLAAVRGKYVVE